MTVMSLRHLLLTALLLALPSQAAEEPPRGNRADLTKPLGTRENPVRACMPRGQQEYMLRLRCPDGRAPEFKRRGSMGRGPYDTTLDGYSVTCQGRTHNVVMDMYHCPFHEKEAVPGLSILPDLAGRLATGCPPRYENWIDEKYVFHPLELKSVVPPPAGVLTAMPSEPGTLVGFEVVITESGTLDESTLRMFVVDREAAREEATVVDPALREKAMDQIRGLRFTPALHHEGCPVRQRLTFPILVRP